MNGKMVEAMFKRGPHDPWALPTRILLTVIYVPLLFVLLVLRSLKLWKPRRRREFAERVSAYWKTEPHRGLAILREVNERLRHQDVQPWAKVEIPPYGRFDLCARLGVTSQLYAWEVALGNFDEALEVARSYPPSEPAVTQQVDCLLAMHRQAEAVALLERSLHLDDWKQTLRNRLESLAGTSRRGDN